MLPVNVLYTRVSAAWRHASMQSKARSAGNVNNACNEKHSVTTIWVETAVNARSPAAKRRPQIAPHFTAAKRTPRNLGSQAYTKVHTCSGREAQTEAISLPIGTAPEIVPSVCPGQACRQIQCRPCRQLSGSSRYRCDHHQYHQQ